MANALWSGACYATTFSLTYDVSGNQIAQQAANAAAPIITGQPNNKQVVVPGGSVGFSVDVASVLPVTYQWYFNGTAISGAMGDSYFLTNFAAAMEGNYTVKVTNSSGSVTSAVATPYIDANGNGLPDSWEMAYFGNLNQTAGGDYDGDGITNIQEFYDGTNPTVRAVNYWIAPTGDFNTASNWSLNRVPGPGDTAVINTGTITLPSNLTNGAAAVTVNVPCTVPTGSDCSINVTGSWTFNGSFTLVDGRQFSLVGGVVTIAGVTNLNGANLLVDNGSTLKFTGLATYAVPAGQNVTWTAQHDGSVLSFPNLKTIAGPTTPGTYLNLVTQYADTGSTVLLSLPALTTITKADDGDPYANSGVSFNANNSGTISAPLLATFHDNDSHPNSGLSASGTGVLSLPKLLAPVGVGINLNAASHPEQFTSLVGTSYFGINEGTVSMTKLNSIAGFSQIVVDNGAQLTFPNVTSYTAPGFSVTWTAQHDGSVLSFPNLKTIAGPTTPGAYLNLITQYADTGSVVTISLPALATITKADDGDPYANSGVGFNANGSGTISAPLLATFDDNDSHPNSGLSASGTGVLALPKLLAPVGVGINLNAASNPQQFTSLVGTSYFGINEGTVSMTKLNSIVGFNQIVVDTGAQLTFPNVISYTAPGFSVSWTVEHPGSMLSFPNLKTIAGPTTPGTYLSLTAQYADNGSTVLLSLPALTTITKADDGDGYNNSGVSFNANGSGTISAPLLATFDDNDSHPNSSLNASGTGVLSLPNLALPGIRGVTLNGVTLPPSVQFIITSESSVGTTVGQPFTYQITATNSPTSFGATGLPASLGINTATGVISGTPSSVGTAVVTISATNAGGTVTEELTISVEVPAPKITSSLTASAVVGQTFSYLITATNNPTSYAASGLPVGLSIGTSSGTISGTPTQLGSFSVSLSATNGSGVATATLALTISNATHPSFFSGETPLSNGVYYLTFSTGHYFGYYSYLTDPRYIYHFDLGYEYVFDAADGKSGVYFYDFTSSDFFYTSPSFPFPYLYDFNLKSVLYYYPDPSNPGHYDSNGVRYFYDVATGKIISK